ncbi:hypothetical protein M9H77_18672 [Catharanthus roseus]|uniref:Uncharacterized protein n=1 Tax=Catharanthus roseus TaxID=4058 RepID=A0ACC0B833_CATRO|nr:hypothetical protein M9H77_18672 [Catharanthus roseus]
MARRMEEEYQGKIAIFKEMIQDLYPKPFYCLVCKWRNPRNQAWEVPKFKMKGGKIFLDPIAYENFIERRTRDHSTIFGGETICTRRLKTSWLKASNEEFRVQIEGLEEFT